MGWWWSSTPSNEHSTRPSPPSPTTPDDAPTTAPSEPTMTASPTTSSKPLSRDEQADADLRTLIAEFSAEQEPSAPSAPSASTTSDAAAAATSPIDPTALYPTTMSCSQAFDLAFYCQSLGGQFNNVYRQGTLRDCRENWADFWFCMRSKTYGEEKRRQKIRDHYRRRAEKYQRGPSSEDVWDLRLEPVEGAFMADLEAAEREEARLGREGVEERGEVPSAVGSGRGGA